jgi:hypothetical protein
MGDRAFVFVLFLAIIGAITLGAVLGYVTIEFFRLMGEWLFEATR